MRINSSEAANLEFYRSDTYIAGAAASSLPGVTLNAAVDEKIPSGFETNAGSFRAGKNRSGEGKPGPEDKGSFRGWHQQKQSEAGKKPKFVPPEEPTPERKAKGDRPKKTTGGFYRAPPPIERLRDRGGLDANPSVARAMCEAAWQLYNHFYESGLNGVRAQDLSREIRGSGTPASSFPRTERALHHRQKFRDACEAMGWFQDFPHRGAGRIVVDVCCYQTAVEDASKICIGRGRNELILASATDRLREGLFILARHWRLI